MAPTLVNDHNVPVTYVSTNPAVATVSDNGGVRIVAEGTTTIKAISEETSEYAAGEASYLLIVEDGRQTPTLVFAQDEYTAKIGDVFTNELTFNPDYLNITYTSSNPEVATIDESTGEVTAIAVGTTVITAKSEQNDELKPGEASYTLTVVDGRELPTLAFAQNAYIANIGDVFTNALTYPEGLVIAYTSSNAEVATVDENGEVTAIAAGEAVITAKSEENETYQAGETSFVLNVQDPTKIDETVTFDFTGDTAYGMTLLSGNTQDYNPDPYTCTEGEIVMTLSGKTRWWSAKPNQLRFYKESSFTISTENPNIKITKVVFDGNNNDWNSVSWEGNQNSVTFTNKKTSSNTAVKKVTVTYITIPSVSYKFTEVSDGIYEAELTCDNKYATIYYQLIKKVAEAPMRAAAEGFTEYTAPFQVALGDKINYYAELGDVKSDITELPVDENTTTGLENVVVDGEGEAEYFDLMGRRVLNPANGVFIRRTAGNTVKVVL